MPAAVKATPAFDHHQLSILQDVLMWKPLANVSEA
jgi:hypothetical protein